VTALILSLAFATSADPVTKWDVAEVTLPGPKDGNPFVDVTIAATFRHNDRAVSTRGFYDGNGTYKIRFLPDAEGEWTYLTASNRTELDGRAGKLTVGPAKPGRRGLVRVRGDYHFEYADGTPHYSFGTTCYAWIHQPEEIQKQTLATLKAGPFNKIRMCVFPKWYAYNKTEPARYPFVGTPPNKWDYERFDLDFFRHLETRVRQLDDLGIEADLILLHPYDEGHWGFDRMSAAADDRYLKYVIARLSAYPNVWWSLANEFDFMKEKTDKDWDRYLKIVNEELPPGRLRSIHNGTRIWNQNDARLTHASIQNGSAVSDFGRAVLHRDLVRKPVVFDEVKYEGDFDQRWGNLSAQEMVHRFWQGAIGGTYVGHGETFRDKGPYVWWSHGGTLHGRSPARIGFLRKLQEAGPKEGWEPIDKWQDDRTAGKKGEYYVVYLGNDAPKTWPVDLPLAGLKEAVTLTADVIDTWGMTVTPAGTFTLKPNGRYRMTAEPKAEITLPGKPYYAIRLTAGAKK
jgi:hypothetical protein